jgi:HEPN domain-containing protein
MEKITNNLTAAQCQELHEIATMLANYYRPEKIICFGCLHNSREASGSFIEPVIQNNHHYFLLMATLENIRMEHEVQDYVNSHIAGPAVTILVHGIEIITDAINQGSRFFIHACRDGILLYTADGHPLNIRYPKPNPAKLLARAEAYYLHRYGMAIGFMNAAVECCEKEFYNHAVFMLHQAVEQACITLIRVHIGYRSDMHNLNRLLNLCLCFSAEPNELFPRKTEEEKRLFQILVKSYSDARYKDDYQVARQDAELLCAQVTPFMELTEMLCKARLDEYRQAAEAAAEQPIDFSPALPGSINS